MKTTRILFGLFLFSLLGLQALGHGPIVERVTFLTDSGEELVLESAPLSSFVGEEFRSENLISDVNALKNALPQYQNIVTTVRPTTENQDYVEIIFELQLKRIIQSLRLVAEGDLEIPMDLRERLSLQRHGEFNSSDLERDKQMIIEHFMNKGYPSLVVEHEMILSPNGHDVDLTYRIIPNSERLVVSKLKFHGNETFENLRLRKVFKTKPRSFFLFRHNVFSLNQLQEDMEELTKFYRDQGFLDIQASFDYHYNEKGRTRIDINITEGSRYFVKEVKLIHGGLYDDEDIRRSSDFSGKGAYSDKALRSLLQDLREFYGERGHALVQVLSTYDSFNKTLLVKIIEGPIFYIDEVLIEGHQRMDRDIIFKEVDIHAGEIFNKSQLTKTLKNMKKTGFYEDVTIEFDQTSSESGNIVINVTEARTKTISFGAGTGTNGIMGELSFQDRNFLNSGKALSLHLKRMAEMTKIGLVYHDPYFKDDGYSLNFSTSFTDSKQEGFDERKVDALLMVEKKITKNLSLGVGTRIEFLNLSEIDEEIRLADHNADGEDRIVGMVGTLFYKTETKDAAGDTSEGVKIHMAMLPSYSDQGAYMKAFSTIMATESLYENEHGVSHSLSGRVTVGYASENAPFHEKFFAGGVGTLRGFKRKSIKTEAGDGGQLLLSGAASYSFPIWEDKVKGVLFLEAASVGDRLDQLGNIRSVGGLGVKANLMDTFLGSMIEAGVAIPLRKEEGDELQPFYFIFGDYDPAYDL